MSMLKALKSLVFRGTIKRVNDGMQMQSLTVEGYAGEEDSDVEKFEPYGFTSNPPVSSEVICFRLGGEREHTIAIMGTQRGKRVKGKLPGVSTHYGFDGQAVTCGLLGNITIVPTLAGVVSIGAEVGGVPAVKTGDPVVASANLTAYFVALQVATGVPVPVGPIGNATGTTTKVLISP